MKYSINLLPQNFRRRQLTLTMLKRWSVVVGVVLLLAMAAGWLSWSRVHNQLAKLELLERENAPLEKMRKEIETIKSNIATLQQRESLVLELADEQSMLTLMGIVSSSANACRGHVSVKRFQVEQNHGIRNGKTGNFKVLRLEGIGSDNIWVAKFANALRETNAFDDVQLRSTAVKGASRQEEMDERNYIMECFF